MPTRSDSGAASPAHIATSRPARWASAPMPSGIAIPITPPALLIATAAPLAPCSSSKSRAFGIAYQPARRIPTAASSASFAATEVASSIAG